MARRKQEVDRDRTISQPLDSGLAVKSAARVIQILELFDDIQRPASIMEISKALGYPQSSTSALVRSLVTLGYLRHDPEHRTFVTSDRVALLGNWVNAHFIAEGAVLRMMRELSERTDDTIVLAIRNGLHAQYVHVIQATSPARLHMALGTVRPLAYSGAGYALLSQMQTAEATRIITRYNAELADKEKAISVREVLDLLEQTRRKGYVITTGIQIRGGGIIAAPIPQHDGRQRLAVGIGGVSEVLRSREEELGQMLVEAVQRYCTDPDAF